MINLNRISKMDTVKSSRNIIDSRQQYFGEYFGRLVNIFQI